MQSHCAVPFQKWKFNDYKNKRPEITIDLTKFVIIHIDSFVEFTFVLIIFVKTAQVLISYLHDSPEDLKDMCVGI